MSKRIACLISCSDHYDHRMKVVDDCLRMRGFDTIYITSDFDHTGKCVFKCNVPGCVQLHVPPYKRNLSVQRIISHLQFARKAFDYLESLKKEPDLVVGLLPPNFLAYYLAKYKKCHPSVKLIFDIFDLWPETFPNTGLGKVLAPFFGVWAMLRDRSLPVADYITTECRMFQRILRLNNDRSEAVYLCGAELECGYKKPQLAEERWDLCYLGAINNVIGISEICRLVERLQRLKPVTLHIVGAGERQQEFVERLKALGAEVLCYGLVYDDMSKQDIIHRCHFGLNIVRPTACIGLTMKSVEYFRHGLPVISNIPEDTRLLVEKYEIGIHVDDPDTIPDEALSVARCIAMRENVRRTYEAVFTTEVIRTQYQNIFDTQL